VAISFSRYRLNEVNAQSPTRKFGKSCFLSTQLLVISYWSSAIRWQSVYSKHGVDPDRFQIKTLANGLVQEIVIDDSRRTRPVLTLGLKPLLDPADVFPKPSRTDSGKTRPNQLICFKTKASTPSQQLRIAFD
jgi:hypothetical protein